MKNNPAPQILFNYLCKNTKNKGFTLVELLVVVIIVGILTAIALPSFLNSAVAAKQTEAIHYARSILHEQKLHRTKNQVFASSFDELAIGIVSGNTVSSSSAYTYSMKVVNSGVNPSASVKADGLDNKLRSYSGIVEVTTNPSGLVGWERITCESSQPGVVAQYPVDATTCPASYQLITVSGRK